jgi:hypothetical protein
LAWQKIAHEIVALLEVGGQQLALPTQSWTLGVSLSLPSLVGSAATPRNPIFQLGAEQRKSSLRPLSENIPPAG